MAPLHAWAVLPVKRLDEAKSRLDPVLGAAQRRALAESLFERCLGVLTQSPEVHQTLVVSADPAVLAHAGSLGATPIAEEAAGLNGALSLAREHAVREGAQRLLVLACDLPLVSPEDLENLFSRAAVPGVVIAPDRRRQGTNALLLAPPLAIDFAFGENSFQRHQALAAAAGVSAAAVTLPGLAFDVDLPQDWHDLQASGWRLSGRSRRPASAAAAAPGNPAPRLPDLHPSA
jgi:2-phospho-L-lactate guanylyltransferase